MIERREPLRPLDTTRVSEEAKLSGALLQKMLAGVGVGSYSEEELQAFAARMKSLASGTRKLCLAASEMDREERRKRVSDEELADAIINWDEPKLIAFFRKHFPELFPED